MSGYDSTSNKGQRLPDPHEVYTPVLTMSPYWVDGFVFEHELRRQSLKTILETRQTLALWNDELRVVIMKNLILLFRLVNLYLPFVDRPEFRTVVATDMGWEKKDCDRIIDRYKLARTAFSPQGHMMPKDADELSMVLCRLVDNYIEAHNTRTMRSKWTESRQQYFDQLRDAWACAIKNDIRAILDEAPSVPAPPSSQDWLPTSRASRAAAHSRQRSKSPPATPRYASHEQAERQRQYRSRSPIRQALPLPEWPTPSMNARRAPHSRGRAVGRSVLEAREKAETQALREVMEKTKAEKQRMVNREDAETMGDGAKRLRNKVKELAERQSTSGEHRASLNMAAELLSLVMKTCYDVSNNTANTAT